jgi:outer membrane protein assembly factor BamB
MKDNCLRIFALIVVVIFILTGFLVMLPQDLNISEKEPVDDVPYLAPTPQIPRGTRSDMSWPMYRYDLPHLGFSTSSVPDDNSVLWANTTGNGDGYASPVIADGRVFVGSRDGYLYCFDLYTGERLWRTFLSSGDYSISSTPAVANDHLVIFSAGDDNVYRLRVSDGGINWTFNPPGSGAYGGSSPAINNGRVYVGSGNAKLYCLEELTGKEIWSYQAGIGSVRPYGIQSSPAVANGRVFVGSCDGYLYCINETQPGPVASYYWRTNLFDAVFASPAVANGRVYCGSGYYVYSEGTNSHTMFCLNELTGVVIWSYTTGSDILSSPAIAYNNVYFTSTDGSLYCLDALSGGPTPTLHWSNTTGDSWSSPSVSDGKVVVGSRGTNLIYCFNATTGTLIWSYNPGNDIYCSPAIADGKVVVSVRGNPESVYCFGNASTPPPTTDYIQIRDAPNGGGNDLGDPANYPSYPVGHTTTFYGAQYNNTEGYIGDVPITSTWSSSIPTLVDVTSPGASSTITCDDTSWGVVTILLDDGQGHQNTTQVTIIEPTVDYIQIRDAPGGGGNNLCDPVEYPIYWVGHSTTFYGAEYNDTAGYIGDVPSTSTWDSDNPVIVNVSSPGISSTIICNDTAFGLVTITLDDLSGNQNTTQVLVLEPTTDYVLIRDAPIGGGNNLCDPANYPIYPVGDSAQFYGAEYNNTAGYIGDVPASSTWDSTNSAIAAVISPASMTFLTCSDTNWGTVTITLDDGNGNQNTTQVTVLEPEVDYIIISSAPGGIGTWIGDTTYVFGENDTFYAAGFNDTAGWIADVPANWTSDTPLIGNVTFGPSNSTTFDAIDNGTCSITATYDIFSNETGVITITGYIVDYIIIRDSPGGGGSEVGDRSFGVGETANFYAAAYNTSAPGQYIGDVSVTWSSSNITVGNVTTPGISTLFAAQFVGGNCNVTATYDPSIKDVTGTLTVLSAGIDYIRITNTSNGVELTTVFLNVGDSITIFASSYNSSGPTFLGLVGVDWTQSPSLGSFSPSTGSSTLFTAGMSGGDVIVTANYTMQGLTDNFTIVINEPKVDYIEIRDTPGGGGSIVTMDTYFDSDTDEFYAAAYNDTAGYLYDVEVTWTSDNTSVAEVTPIGIWTNFTAQQVDGSGTCTITATYSPEISATTELLTVLLITVDYIQIRDAEDGLGNIVTTGTYIVFEEDQFYTAAYSKHVGYLYDVEVNWSISDSDVGLVSDPGIWTNFTAQLVEEVSTCIVTARYSDMISNTTEALTVIPPSVDYIQILDKNDHPITAITLELEEWIHYFAVGYNHTAGPLGNVNVSWSLTNEIATISSEQDYFTNLTATINGSTTLVASYDSEVSNSTQITINPRISAPTGLVVTPLEQGNALNVSWNKNPEESLAGYNIYRSLLPDSEFRLINTDIITTEYYIDESLVNGVRYYYYVVAVDSLNKLSDPSEIASGVPDIDTDEDGLLNYEDDDDDNDGLTDIEEADKGTDPLKWDTDGDEVNDKDDYYPLNENKWEKEKEEEEGTSLILLLVPIIVIILLLILVILLSKRRKKDEGAPPPIAAEKRDLPPPPQSMQKKEKEMAAEEKENPSSEEVMDETFKDDLPEEESPPLDDEKGPEEDFTPSEDEEISEDELPPPDDEPLLPEQ